MRARRGGHRQDPRHHAPDRLRRAGRGLRPPAGARRDLHRPGGRRDAHPAARPRRRRGAGPHVPRRRAAPAALLLAAARRRRPAAARGAQGRAGRRGGRAAAAGHRPGDRARPQRRDRVGQGHHDRPRRLPGRRRQGRPGPAGRAGPGADGAPALDVRAGQARPQRHRLRGRPALHRRPDRRAPPGRRRGPRAVPPLRRRRVPGRQPAAAGAARPVARRPRGALRRRRPEPDDLLLHRRHPGLPARLPRSATRRPPRCGWCATTAPRRRSSAWPTGSSPPAPHGRRSALELVAQRPAGPEPDLRGATRRAGRGPPRRDPRCRT